MHSHPTLKPHGFTLPPGGLHGFDRVLGASTYRGIKGPSRQEDYRGSEARAFIMAPTYYGSGMRPGSGFNPAIVQGIVQGNSASGIPIRVAISCPVSRIVRSVQTNVQGIIHNGSCRIGRRYISVNFCLLRCVKLITPLMAPRGGYKSPRRGGHSSQSSGTKQRRPTSPKRISPLACASPPSGASTPSEDLDNVVQIATLCYHRRTNKPVIRARITVIFDEEDEVEDSRNQDSGEKMPTTSDNSSKAQDTSYIPEVQSRMEGDSTDFHSAEQAEAAKELRSLKRKAPMTSAEGSMKTQTDPPGSGSQIKEEEDSLDYKLYLKLPPGYDSIEDVPVGVEVSWEPDPIQAAEERKQRALAREAEAKKGSSK